MLTNDQKIVLDRIFAQNSVEQLTIRQTSQIASQTNLSLISIEWYALEKNIIPLRYQRHIESVGIDGQKKLLQSKVIVIGLGGLGGYVVEHLARSGLGHIVAADPDSFAQTDLNRQLLSTEQNLNTPKTTQAQIRINAVNNAVKFTPICEKFQQLPDSTWKQTNLVFDCLDSIEARLTLVEKCSSENVPLIHGAIAGFSGQVALVMPNSKMMNNIYSTDSVGIETHEGTPSFTAAITAGIMVCQAVKFLIAPDQIQQRSLLIFDLKNNDWQNITL